MKAARRKKAAIIMKKPTSKTRMGRARICWLSGISRVKKELKTRTAVALVAPRIMNRELDNKGPKREPMADA